MAKHDQNQPIYKLAGYATLIEQYDLDVGGGAFPIH